MKKILLNILGIIVLSFSFQISKASFYSGNDSTSPKVANFQSNEFRNARGFLYAAPPTEIEGGMKKFVFSLAVTPWFKTTIPPLNLYFERGIAGVASAGLSLGALYDSESDMEYHSATVSIGVRGCAYPLPIISKISGKAINSYGFQPYLGLVYDFQVTAISFGDNEIDPYHSTEFGLCAGTRWYPGKGKFALLGELNTNGLGSDLRFGISLGR